MFCPGCRSEAEKARGTRVERHYDAEYDRARKVEYAACMRASDAGTPRLCRVCGLPMLRGQVLELGHIVPLNLDPTSKVWSMVHKACNPRGTDPRNYQVG